MSSFDSTSIGGHRPDPGRWGRAPSVLESVSRSVVAAGSFALSAASGNPGGAIQSVIGAPVAPIGGGTGGSAGGGDLGDFQQLIQMQLDAQRRMQVITAESNLQKTEHEARMAPVRNMRA